ncbi:MAG TPA: hypothetical protein QGF58_02745 [Myxococcota bacterium]|nr:hypothetical protein [Myxococcota bacterium]
MIALLFTLACSGETEEPESCCSLEDVEEMCSAGLSDELILSTIEVAPDKLELSAKDVITLSDAGCSDAVINTLRGTPVEEVEEEDAPGSASGDDDKPPWVNMSVTVGSRFMDVRNNTNQTLTNLRITVNGQYTYNLTKLGPTDTDSTPKSKYKSSTGGKFAGSMTRVYISCDQGVYSKSY